MLHELKTLHIRKDCTGIIWLIVFGTQFCKGNLPTTDKSIDMKVLVYTVLSFIYIFPEKYEYTVLNIQHKWSQYIISLLCMA